MPAGSQSEYDSHTAGGVRFTMQRVVEWPQGSTARMVLQDQGLTKREVEILMWTTQGKTNWEIGKILGISVHTVSKHLERIFLKLRVHSRIQAIKKWIELSYQFRYSGHEHGSSLHLSAREMAK